MRDKGFVFDEMRRARRTLGFHDGPQWFELAARVVVLLWIVMTALAR